MNLRKLMNILPVSILAVLMLVAFIPIMSAQASTLDPAFNPNLSATLNSIAVQADGKILIGGAFSMIGADTRRSIARLNTDGTLDTSFNYNETVVLQVLSIAVQADAKVLIGGSFISLSGPSRRRIARLNADGTLDENFSTIILSGEGQQVSSIAMQADGKILIGGEFSAVQGTGEASSTTRNNLARLNSDGSLDMSFNPSANMQVNSIVVQDDGKIVIGGVFTTITGTGEASATRNHLARLNANGTLDASFDPNINNTVRAIALQADTKILIGGGFNILFGTGGTVATIRNKIARLSSDGSIDTTFNTDSGGSVEAISVQSDGGIVISGQFTAINGVARSRLARLDQSGDLNNGIDTGLTENGFIWTNALQADGEILAGGFFNSFGNAAPGTTRNNMARIIPPNTDSAPTSTVRAAQDGSYADWLRGGVGPEVVRTTVELSPDGTTWMAPIVGQRINGGWRFNNTNIQLETATQLRLRGYYGASQSIHQEVKEVLISEDTDGPCIPIKSSSGAVVLICL